MAPQGFQRYSSIRTQKISHKVKEATDKTIQAIINIANEIPTNNPWLFGICGSPVNVLKIGYNITSKDIINIFTNKNNKIRIEQVEINT